MLAPKKLTVIRLPPWRGGINMCEWGKRKKKLNDREKGAERKKRKEKERERRRRDRERENKSKPPCMDKDKAQTREREREGEREKSEEQRERRERAGKKIAPDHHGSPRAEADEHRPQNAPGTLPPPPTER